MFESEAGAAGTMATLTDCGVGAWKRNLVVTALVGVVLCHVSAVAAATGSFGLVSLLLAIGILSLVFVVVIWVRAKSVKRQAEGRQ
ncbi:hypothetical protein AAGW05_16655 [Arthrobacter sp. LAPM80]|uniref:hypothetical protein n=1 Tax=Arthrobacter sp. LAPM80 TaxID=3141788 RepID=UPI00398B3CB3